MLYTWEGIQKIVATPKTIGIYCTTDDALIVPKVAFGNRFMAVMQIVALQVKRAIIEASQEVYVLADSSKFGSGYVSVIGPSAKWT